MIRSTIRIARGLLLLGAVIAATGCTGLRNLESPEVVLVALRPLDSTILEQRFEVISGSITRTTGIWMSTASTSSWRSTGNAWRGPPAPMRSCCRD